MRDFFSRVARALATRRKALVFLSLFFIITASFLFFAPDVFAQDTIEKRLLQILGWITQFFVSLFGHVMNTFLFILFAILQYNDFLGSTVVYTGWEVVRDLVNMFFVLVLLAIAVGTILQDDNFHYAKALPKFLFAVILVNFSKTICGLIIDFSQVIMMTFVSAFSNAGPGNFLVLLGVPGLLSWAESAKGAADQLNVFFGLALALIFTIVGTLVLGFMIVALLYRIVWLWLLIVLSPLAFLGWSIPDRQASSVGDQWWQRFLYYVTYGPALAFFLWLTLVVVQNANQDLLNRRTQLFVPIVGVEVAWAAELKDVQIHRELGKDVKWDDASKAGIAVGGTPAGTVAGIAGFLLGIILLIGSLAAAHELAQVVSNAGGGAGATMAGLVTGRGPLSVSNALSRLGTGAATTAQRINKATDLKKLFPKKEPPVYAHKLKSGPLKGHVATTGIKGMRVQDTKISRSDLERMKNSSLTDRGRDGAAPRLRHTRAQRALGAEGTREQQASGGAAGRAKLVGAEAHGLLAGMHGIRTRFPKLFGGGVQATSSAGAKATGALLSTALMAGGLAGAFGKRGAGKMASAREMQRQQITNVKEQLTGEKKGREETRQIADGVLAGPTGAKNLDRMGAMLHGVEQGHYSPEELPELRKKFGELGADQESLKAFDTAAFGKEMGDDANEKEPMTQTSMRVGELHVGRLRADAVDVPPPQQAPQQGREEKKKQTFGRMQAQEFETQTSAQTEVQKGGDAGVAGARGEGAEKKVPRTAREFAREQKQKTRDYEKSGKELDALKKAIPDTREGREAYHDTAHAHMTAAGHDRDKRIDAYAKAYGINSVTGAYVDDRERSHFQDALKGSDDRATDMMLNMPEIAYTADMGRSLVMNDVVAGMTPERLSTMREKAMSGGEVEQENFKNIVREVADRGRYDKNMDQGMVASAQRTQRLYERGSGAPAPMAASQGVSEQSVDHGSSGAPHVASAPSQPQTSGEAPPPRAAAPRVDQSQESPQKPPGGMAV